MKHLMVGAAAIALLVGCQNENGGAMGGGGYDVTARAGDAEQAGSALLGMSLTKSGKGLLTFAESSVDGASAEFTSVGLAGFDEITAQSLTLEGLDMTEGEANFAVMRFNNVAFSAPDDEAEISIGAIELINPTPALAGWIAETLETGSPSDFPSFDDIGFDSWSVSDVSMEFEDRRDSGAFSLGKVEILGLGGDEIARVGIAGLSLNVDDSGEAVEIDLGQLAMSNIDSGFLSAVADNIDDEEDMALALVDLVYSNPMDPGYDSVRMDDFSFSFDGVSFAIPSVDSSIQRNSAGQPVKYVTKPYSMSLTADAEAGDAGAELSGVLSLVGFQEVVLTGESVGTYDPDLDIIEFKARSNYFELVDAARFSFGGKIEGYSAYAAEVASGLDLMEIADGYEPDPMAMAAAFAKITLHDLEFSIKDDGLVDRVIGLVAVQMDQDPEALKSQVSMGLSMAPMMASSSGVDMGLVTELATALGSFIDDPKTLRIAFEPSEPLAFSSVLENPDPSAYTKDMLGFSAANK